MKRVWTWASHFESCLDPDTAPAAKVQTGPSGDEEHVRFTEMDEVRGRSD